MTLVALAWVDAVEEQVTTWSRHDRHGPVHAVAGEFFETRTRLMGTASGE